MSHTDKFAHAAQALAGAVTEAEAALEALGLPSVCWVPIPPAGLTPGGPPIELWWRREKGTWGLFVRKGDAVRNSSAEYQHLNDCALRVKCAAVSVLDELRSQLVYENQRTLEDVERATRAARAFARKIAL